MIPSKSFAFLYLYAALKRLLFLGNLNCVVDRKHVGMCVECHSFVICDFILTVFKKLSFSLRWIFVTGL